MDQIMEDIHAELRRELGALWGVLQVAAAPLSPEVRKEIQRKLKEVERLAIQIGGQIQSDTGRLEKRVSQFLSGRLNSSETFLLFQDVLKLEQDAREL